MSKEFKALKAKNTWDIVQLPEGKKVLPCKWVYKIKYKQYGTVKDSWHELLLWGGGGHSKERRIFYINIFSFCQNEKYILSAVKKNWHISQLDVNNTFSHGDL